MTEATKENPIGEVTHYYSKINVAIVKFYKTVPIGTKIKFKGSTTNFDQVISSIQFDHKELSEALKNQEVGIKVNEKVREGDKVFEVV
ncbi:MAG: translation elongation factor-like protein [Minisyncoccia bacterium]